MHLRHFRGGDEARLRVDRNPEVFQIAEVVLFGLRFRRIGFVVTVRSMRQLFALAEEEMDRLDERQPLPHRVNTVQRTAFGKRDNDGTLIDCKSS